MNRTIKDIQKDIEQLGIKGGYDVEQLLTPQDCRRLSYEIERLNNIINEFDKWLENINIGELDDFFIGVKLSELKKAWNDIKGSDKE